MTISAYIALIRDAAILAALGYILWFIHRADENAIKVKELQAVTKQLQANAKTEAQYAQERQDAEIKQRLDMESVRTLIAGQRAPIWLRQPSGGGSLSRPPATPPSQPAPAGGAHAGSGGDLEIRQAITAFEFKFEQALGDCRSIAESWPH